MCEGSQKPPKISVFRSSTIVPLLCKREFNRENTAYLHSGSLVSVNPTVSNCWTNRVQFHRLPSLLFWQWAAWQWAANSGNAISSLSVIIDEIPCKSSQISLQKVLVYGSVFILLHTLLNAQVRRNRGKETAGHH